MTKRKTPKEVIESEPSNVEHFFIKGPRGKLIRAMKGSRKRWVEPDTELEAKFLRKRKGKPYTEMHTHLYDLGDFEWGIGLPGDNDLMRAIDKRGKIKTTIITQRDLKTGEVQGYTYLHDRIGKTNAEELSNSQQNIEKAIDKFQMRLIENPLSVEGHTEEFIKMAKAEGFDLRFHPERGYYFNKKEGNYEKKPAHSLEGAVSSILIGFAFMFLLTKIPFTGFAIANASSNRGILFPLIFGFLLSLVAYFVLMQIKRLIEIEKKE